MTYDLRHTTCDKYGILVYTRLLLLLVLTTTCSNGNNGEGYKSNAGKEPQIECKICSQSNSVAGDVAEWKNNTISIINNKTAFGACIDNKFLYLYFTTSDPEISMQIMNFGLTVWIDPLSSHDKSLGVQFPIYQMQPPPPKEGKPPEGAELQQFLAKRLKDLVIVLPKSKDQKKMSIPEANNAGIYSTIKVDRQNIYYLLKYPLYNKETNKSGIDIQNHKKLDICFETPEIDFNKLNKKTLESTKPPDAERLQNASNQRMEPKPPQLTRVSQWIQVQLL